MAGTATALQLWPAGITTNPRSPELQNMVPAAKAAGEDWADYKWPYPGTKVIRDKAIYVVTNKEGFFCGVGAYK